MILFVPIEKFGATLIYNFLKTKIDNETKEYLNNIFKDSNEITYYDSNFN